MSPSPTATLYVKGRPVPVAVGSNLWHQLRRRGATETPAEPIHPDPVPPVVPVQTEESRDMPDSLSRFHDADAVQFKADELVSNASSTIIDWFKHQPKPWGTMSHAEQQMLCENAHKLARETVRECVRVIAAEGRKVVLANLEQVNVKDEIKAVLKASKHSEYRHELTDATGKDVLIVVADASDFDQSGGMPEPDAPTDDQHGLPLDGDDKPIFDNTDAGRE